MRARFFTVLVVTVQLLWATAGEKPITISYKWLDHGKMLFFPVRFKPGGSVNVQAKSWRRHRPGISF
jgi:hypothetical protein